jgi:hypothetical protein
VDARTIAGSGVVAADCRPAGRASNDIVLSDPVRLFPESQFTLTFEDEKHLLFGTVRVKRALSAPRWKLGQVVAQLPSADGGAELSASGRVEAVLLDIGEFDVFEIHEGLAHVFCVRLNDNSASTTLGIQNSRAMTG